MSITFNDTHWKIGKILMREKAKLRFWLCQTHSVSEVLHDLLGTNFKIKLHHNYFCRSDQEQKMLFPDGDQNFFIREVLIYKKDTPIIYAQARFPSKIIKQLPEITELGESSLGIFLLQQGCFYKEKMEFAYLNRKGRENKAITEFAQLNYDESYLCRKSTFRINNNKAEVIEVFLPEFIKIFNQIKT